MTPDEALSAPHAAPSPASSALRLKLLGTMQATWHGEPLPVTAPRMLGLLAYLHLQGEVPRKELELMFWPGQGANAVRQGLYTLRRQPGAGEWLRDGPLVSLDANSDLQDIHALLQKGQDAETLNLLSAGPLLEHLHIGGNAEFNDWLEQERQKLLELRRAALKREAQRLSGLGNYAAARTHLQTLLDLDPLDEPTWRDLMRLEAERGHPEAALDTFESLRRTLHAELRIEPDAETLALLHELEGHEIGGQTRARLLTPAHLTELQLDPLCGRQDELADLLAHLSGKRRALVQGMAGMGKTRLGWAVAEHHLGVADGAAGQVLWLELGGDPPESLLPALAEPLGLKQLPPRTAPQTLHDALHARQVGLVVLDNAANTYALSVLLEYLPPELPVLVTSRLRLPRLPTLSLHRLPRQDALKLIGQHLSNSSPDRQQPDGQKVTDSYSLDALCAVLGDHPYALRLAARTLIQSGQTPRELLQTLTDAPHALGAEHSIHALLQQSTGNLDAASYEAYLGLGSLFTPQATPELLALALRRDPEATEQALYTLTQHGLTTREAHGGSDSVVFRMHELTWHDAKAHAALQGKTVVEAVRQYAHANTHFPEALYTELPNLIAGAQYAQKHWPDELVQIMVGWLGGQYIAARGFPLGYCPLLQQAIKIALSCQAWDRASVLGGKLGNIQQVLLNDYSQAVATYLQAAELAELTGNLNQQALCLSAAGIVQTLHHLPGAEKTRDKARQSAEESGNVVCIGQVLQQEGIAQAMQGEYQQAYDTIQRARQFLQRHSLPDHPQFRDIQLQYRNAVGNLGHACLRLERMEEAVALKREALALARSAGEEVWLALSLTELGELLIRVNQVDEAREVLIEAVQVSRRLGAPGQLESARKALHSIVNTHEHPDLTLV